MQAITVFYGLFMCIAHYNGSLILIIFTPGLVILSIFCPLIIGIYGLKKLVQLLLAINRLLI